MNTYMPVALLALALVTSPMSGTAADITAADTKADNSAYVTCREAHAMEREARIRFVVDIVQRAAAHYGVDAGEGGRLDTEIAALLRSGCTVFPEAYVQTLAALAVRRAGNAASPSIAGQSSIPFARAVFVSCAQYAEMTDAQQDAIEFDLAVHAGRHYGMLFEDAPAARARFDEGITPLVHGTCRLLPELYIYAVVARAVQAEAEQIRPR